MQNKLFTILMAAVFLLQGCGETQEPTPDGNPNDGPVAGSGWVADYDPGFNSGSGFKDSQGRSAAAFKIVPFNDQLLVGTSINTSYNGTPIGQICRINKDGSLDTSFDSRQSFSGTWGGIYDILKLRDGKILVVGSFEVNNAAHSKSLAILNADGSLDASFTLDGIGPSGNGLFACAEDSEGRILVGGFIFSYDEDYNQGDINIFRYNRNGERDYSFGATFDAEVDDIKIDKNNKIWVVGRFEHVSGQASRYVAVLNEDGSVYKTNTDLMDNGSFVVGAYGVNFQTDGKAIVSGNFRYAKNGEGAASIARFNTDLSLDDTFAYSYGLSCCWDDDWMKNTFITASDEILVTGNFTPKYLGMLNSDGSLSDTFITDDKFSSATNDIWVDAENMIYVVGSFSTYEGNPAVGIVRLKGGAK